MIRRCTTSIFFENFPRQVSPLLLIFHSTHAWHRHEHYTSPFLFFVTTSTPGRSLHLTYKPDCFEAPSDRELGLPRSSLDYDLTLGRMPLASPSALNVLLLFVHFTNPNVGGSG